MRKYLIGISTAAVMAVAAGCGGTDDAGVNQEPAGASTASSTVSSAYNDQDIVFAQMMVPHHQQALDMTKLAAEKATDQKVKDLATRIQGAQDPEIQELTTLLDAWGVREMSGMDHSSMSGHGMMTDDQMTQLEQATGAGFDRMWLQMMIEHHEGAVTMAKAEVEQGSNPEAKALAQQVVDAQVAEITEMQGMLA
jgi:uncharacterized protein (DUF305 family)